MKKSKELKIERAAKIDAQNNLATAAEARDEGKRDFNKDEKKSFDDLQAEILVLDADIKRSEILEANEKRAAAANGSSVDPEKRELKKMAKRFSILRALRMAADQEPIDGLEAEVNQMAKHEAREAGISLGKHSVAIPGVLMRTAKELKEQRAAGQTVTLDSANYGGELVDTQVQLIDGLKPTVVVEGLGATILSNLQGNVSLPTVADYSFAWLAEDADTTAQKQLFTGPTLSPKRAAALVPISHQLLKQSSAAVDQVVMRALGNGYGQALMTAVINGAGTTDPLGILNVTNVGEAADTVAVAPTWAKIVELEGIVKTANGIGMGYLMHPKTEAALKTISKDAGSGRFLIENGMLNGYPYAVSTAVPALNTGTTYPLIFGDFAELFIGSWGGVSFLVDPFTGAAGNKVNIHVNAHADANVANPGAFAINTWLTF